MPMKDQDYGDRNGGLNDPVGNSWYVAHRQSLTINDSLA